VVGVGGSPKDTFESEATPSRPAVCAEPAEPACSTRKIKIKDNRALAGTTSGLEVSMTSPEGSLTAALLNSEIQPTNSSSFTQSMVDSVEMDWEEEQKIAVNAKQ
jgi:hypothetical protein